MSIAIGKAEMGLTFAYFFHTLSLRVDNEITEGKRKDLMMIIIDQDRLVKQFMDFVRIDSPSFEEAPFVAALEEELKKLGLAVENDHSGRNGAGNLFSVLPGTNRDIPPILFCMHTDTVEPGRGIKPRLENGWIRSDGTTILGADNKSALAGTLEAVRWLQAQRPAHGDVEFLFTWAEERGHQGARAFDISRLHARIGFVPDGGGPLGTIITQAPYYDSVRATFVGKAAHAGLAPESGISAIVMASQAVSRMPLGRVAEGTTANIGKISGGAGRNIVPEKAEIEGEARSLVLENLEAQISKMRMAMEEAAQAMGGQVQVEINREYDGFHVREDDFSVRIAERASQRVGLIPSIASTNGGSDGNDLNAKGIRTIVLGMGGRDFHSTQEAISVADLVKLSEWIAAVVVEAGRK
jgi:tripeptide aminopeptidase